MADTTTTNTFHITRTTSLITARLGQYFFDVGMQQTESKGGVASVLGALLRQTEKAI